MMKNARKKVNIENMFIQATPIQLVTFADMKELLPKTILYVKTKFLKLTMVKDRLGSRILTLLPHMGPLRLYIS